MSVATRAHSGLRSGLPSSVLTSSALIAAPPRLQNGSHNRTSFDTSQPSWMSGDSLSTGSARGSSLGAARTSFGQAATIRRTPENDSLARHVKQPQSATTYSDHRDETAQTCSIASSSDVVQEPDSCQGSTAPESLSRAGIGESAGQGRVPTSSGWQSIGSPVLSGHFQSSDKRRSRAAELTAEFRSSVNRLINIRLRSGAPSLRDTVIGTSTSDRLDEDQYRSQVWEKASDWAKNIKATQGGFCINNGERIDVSQMDEDVMTAAAVDILLKHDAERQRHTRKVVTEDYTNQMTGDRTVTHRGDTWALGYKTMDNRAKV
ncbi:hypothetical protein I316_05991 [Kwoniella heveanensis BCC8398]|uniref:Uncharacterized protein n=1 Tax=Kwoniella heveanensis BCC8398 TaxID=1296120 RepID=A0A1B9GMW9_9TREE|nr:hypothetical protein I316_05991 [Kwoniella heveanensis BCC8398]